MNSRVPLESEEGRTFVAYLRVKHIKFTHVGNETGHDPYSRRRAIRMKQQGTSKGFPDYLVLTNTGLIAIELKRQKGSTTSPEQREWIEALQAAGTPAYIAKGAQAAIELVERHHNPNGVEF
jgi:hypothetical protein